MFESIRKYRELIIYFIVGCLTTAVNWLVYAVLVEGLHLGVALSNGIAWTAAVLFAYLANKIWVFRSYDWSPVFVFREAGLFVSARIATGVFEVAAVPLLVRLGLDQKFMGVRGMWAKILVSAVVLVLNYVFSKLIVFRRRDQNPAEDGP